MQILKRKTTDLRLLALYIIEENCSPFSNSTKRMSGCNVMLEPSKALEKPRAFPHTVGFIQKVVHDLHCRDLSDGVWVMYVQNGSVFAGIDLRDIRHHTLWLHAPVILQRSAVTSVATQQEHTAHICHPPSSEHSNQGKLFQITGSETDSFPSFGSSETSKWVFKWLVHDRLETTTQLTYFFQKNWEVTDGYQRQPVYAVRFVKQACGSEWLLPVKKIGELDNH